MDPNRASRRALAITAILGLLGLLGAAACDDGDASGNDDDTATTDTTSDAEDTEDTAPPGDTTDEDTGAEDTADTSADTNEDADLDPGDLELVHVALDGACTGGKPPGNGVAPGTDLHKVTLDAYPDALCNDGSPAIMYVRAAATVANQGRWVIHMQAGGSCGNYDVCYDRWCGIGAYEADKMSSRFAPEATQGSGLFSRGANNLFGDANQVYIYYCSSDSWTGQRSDAVLEDEDGTRPPFRLHFRGHDILVAAAAELHAGTTSDDGVETLPSLSTATEVLFSGSSAGSQGLTQSLDWWVEQVPNAQRVAGMLDSLVLPLPEDIDDPTVAERYRDGLQVSWTTIRQELYNAFSDESCVAMHNPDDAWLCGLTTHVQLDHLTTPYFVRQDLTDPVTFAILEPAGASLDQYATWTRATLDRFATVADDAEESDAIDFTPGRHASNCAQHIVMLNGPWFGTAATDNATVETPNGTELTVHDALAAWIAGNPVSALDTHPSTLSVCAGVTDDQ